jgi:hypothetical protein
MLTTISVTVFSPINAQTLKQQNLSASLLLNWSWPRLEPRLKRTLSALQISSNS